MKRHEGLEGQSNIVNETSLFEDEMDVNGSRRILANILNI